MFRAIGTYLAGLLGFALISSALVGLLWGRYVAEAFAFGSLIGWFVQTWFTLRVFAATSSSPHVIYARMAGAETGKLLLVGALFGLLFWRRPDIAPGPLFSGLSLMLLAQLIGGGLLTKKLVEIAQTDLARRSQQSP